MEANMVSSITFTVWPTRRQFIAMVEAYDYHEFDRMYHEAHVEAATFAAIYGHVAYVTIDQHPQHTGFTTNDWFNRNSTLSRIMRVGMIRSYWSFETRSWHQLPLDLEADEGYIIARRLLPPPTKNS